MKKRSLTEPYGNNKKHRVDNNIDSTRYTTRTEPYEKTETPETNDATFYANMAEQYFRQGYHAMIQFQFIYEKRGVATELFEKAAILQPNNAVYNEYAGDGYLKLGNPIKAHRFLVQAAKINQTNAKYNYDAGDSHLRLGNFTEAAAFLDQSTKLDPTNTRYHEHAALAYLKLGNYKKATELFKISINLGTPSFFYQQFLNGNDEHDTDIITNFLMPICDNIIENNNEVKAIKCAKNLLAGLLVVLVECTKLTQINKDHNIKKALELYSSIDDASNIEKIIKLDPDNIYGFKAKACYEAGNFYLLYPLYNDALNHYKEVIKLNPEFVDAYVQAGIAANALGQVELAEEYQSIVRQHFRATYDQLQDYSTTNYDTEYPAEIDGLIMGYLAGATQEETSMLGSIDILDSGL